MPRTGLVALVDMDGTLCDYHGAMARSLAALHGEHEAASPVDE